MIITPTVFVLGAGASIPYGFPSGAELRKEICQNAITRESSLTFEMLNNNNELEVGHIVEFANAFLDSSVNSIDSFLARNPKYVDVGKFAIAAVLCKKEDPSAFKRLDNDDNWYAALWNALIADVDTIEELKRNTIKVVTFNYDRSLEYFLHTAIKNTFGASDAEALNALSFIPILHVYGSLGEYREGGRSYQQNNDSIALRIAADSIKIIPEARERDATFLKAQDWFREAEVICFLGFGFDKLNVRRLNLSTIISERSVMGRFTPNFIYSSCLGFTEEEMSMASELLGAQSLNWRPCNGKNLRTLRNFARILA
ncbi:MAG: hypothetical protein EWV52_14085 [Microcystis panniformis Mp_MB_F_20051200_S6D]|nr:MAG: hypothetical protein EWV52_14085 [Microcystis panniformis Mp_MB_F_20051200_S6D]